MWLDVHAISWGAGWLRIQAIHTPRVASNAQRRLAEERSQLLASRTSQLLNMYSDYGWAYFVFSVALSSLWSRNPQGRTFCVLAQSRFESSRRSQQCPATRFRQRREAMDPQDN
jgi:hypothetical protein